jgi:hypothetical protein
VQWIRSSYLGVGRGKREQERGERERERERERGKLYVRRRVENAAWMVIR